MEDNKDDKIQKEQSLSTESQPSESENKKADKEEDKKIEERSVEQPVKKRNPKLLIAIVAAVSVAVICGVVFASCNGKKAEASVEPTATATVKATLYDNARDVTLLDKDGKQTSDKITVATVKKSEATPSALTDWYFDHVKPGGYKYGILNFSDDTGKGIYADSTGIYESDLKQDSATKDYAKPADSDKVYSINESSKAIKKEAAAKSTASTSASAEASPSADANKEETASNQQTQQNNSSQSASQSQPQHSASKPATQSKPTQNNAAPKQTCVTKTRQVQTGTQTIHHDAVTHVVHHDAVTHVVHHPAATHDVIKCSACGKTFDANAYGGSDAAIDACIDHAMASHPGASYSVITVADSQAWDETVVDQGAWDETVVDQGAWDEQVPVYSSEPYQECN